MLIVKIKDCPSKNKLGVLYELFQRDTSCKIG